MLDTTALVRSIASPPALSHDTPIVSDNLPVTDDTPLSSVAQHATSEDIMTIDTSRRPALAQFFQDSEDLMDEEDDPLKDHVWEDDTVD